ncbi:sodium-independent anion transporter, partial [Oleispira antarctica]
VSGVTVVTDLAVAVVVGVIVAALSFAWEHAKHIFAIEKTDEDGTKIYEIQGPLFFGSVANFKDLFDPKTDPDKVIIEFKNSRVADHSAIEAIDSLAVRYIAEGKELHLRHLSAECRLLLKNAGDLCDVNVLEDPKYFVADDKLA